MELTREAWTDERLDDLANRMDRGFDRVDAAIRDLRGEMKEEFAAVRGEMKEEFAAVRTEMRGEFAALRTEMKDEFTAVRGEIRGEVGSLRKESVALWGEVNARLDGIQQTMIRSNGALLVAMVALVLAVLLRGA